MTWRTNDDTPRGPVHRRPAPYQALLSAGPLLRPSAAVAVSQLWPWRDRRRPPPRARSLRNPRRRQPLLRHRLLHPRQNPAATHPRPWRDLAHGGRGGHWRLQPPLGGAAGDHGPRRRAWGGARDTPGLHHLTIHRIVQTWRSEDHRHHRPRRDGLVCAADHRSGGRPRAARPRMLCLPLRRPRSHLGNGAHARLAAPWV